LRAASGDSRAEAPDSQKRLDLPKPKTGPADNLPGQNVALRGCLPFFISDYQENT